MTRTALVCRGALDHRPMYAEVDRHHVFPAYLANLLGVAPPREVVNLCSGCHDYVHHLLHHMINEGELPGHSRLPRNVRALVVRAFDWWAAELVAP